MGMLHLPSVSFHGHQAFGWILLDHLVPTNCEDGAIRSAKVLTKNLAISSEDPLGVHCFRHCSANHPAQNKQQHWSSWFEAQVMDRLPRSHLDALLDHKGGEPQ